MSDKERMGLWWALAIVLALIALSAVFMTAEDGVAFRCMQASTDHGIASQLTPEERQGCETLRRQNGQQL